MTHRPLLLRFAKPCVSPDRAPLDSNYIYDEDVDMIRWLRSSEHLTVVEVYKNCGPEEGPEDPPATKKADIEKGEDQKDRRMWGRN